MKRILLLTATLLIGVGIATAQSPDCCCPHWAKTASLTGTSTSASAMSTQEALDWVAKLKEQQEQKLARLKHQRAMRRKRAAKLKANSVKLYAPKSSGGIALLLPAGEPPCPPLLEPEPNAALISDFRGCPRWSKAIPASGDLSIGGPTSMDLTAEHQTDCLSAEYAPKSNITAYELSQLLPYIVYPSNCMTSKDWDLLGVSVTRHLKRIPKPPCDAEGRLRGLC